MRLVGVGLAADDVDFHLLEIGEDGERETLVPSVTLGLEGGAVAEIVRGLLRLAHEAVAPIGAEEVVRALRPSADLRAALDLDLALLRDVAGLVLHVPAERGEERVQELLPQARLVVAGLLVVTEVLLEDAGEPRKLCREGIKRRRGCHARVVNGGGRNVERGHMD